MNNVTFPALGLSFDMNPVLFSIGPFTIRWYAFLIATGLVLAVVYCMKHAKHYGVDTDRLSNAVLVGIVGAIIGARLYYVIFKLDHYLAHPSEIFAIWNGGLAIYGGLIGGILAAYFVCRAQKVKFTAVLDVACIGFFIGQGIGRWGNFVNAEAFGSNTNLPWGMSGTSISNYLSNHIAELSGYGVAVDPSSPVHPTFLYESIWCLIGFLILHFFYKHRKFDGENFLIYTAWYGLGRFFIEGLRTDSLMLGQIRVSQLLAGVLVIASAAIWLVARSKVKKDPGRGLAVLYVNTEEAQEVLKNGYQPKKKKTSETESEVTESDSINTIVSEEPETDSENVPKEQE